MGGATAAQAQDEGAPSASERDAEPDNGNDPTRVRRWLAVNFEHLDLRGGFTSDRLEAMWSEPLGSRTALDVTVALSSVDTAGNESFGFGDRFGIVHVDFETQKRTPKLSADWFREAARQNAVV